MIAFQKKEKTRKKRKGKECKGNEMPEMGLGWGGGGGGSRRWMWHSDHASTDGYPSLLRGMVDSLIVLQLTHLHKLT